MTKNLESKNYDCNFTALFNNLKLSVMEIKRRVLIQAAQTKKMN